MMKAKWIPFAEAAFLITIVLVLGGGLMILTGWRVRWAAALLSLWMIPATFYFHAFWSYPPEQLFNQNNHFLKNFALTGTFLFIVGMGSRDRVVQAIVDQGLVVADDKESGVLLNPPSGVNRHGSKNH